GNSLVLSPASAGDVDVGGSVHVITAGEQQYCAILVDGSLRCWGENIHGELGYGHTEMIGDDETPSSAGPVDVGGLAVVAAAPHNHTCVVLDGGSVRCWGLSRQGLLGVGYGLDNVGDDELPTAIDPVDVGGPVASLASNFQST